MPCRPRDCRVAAKLDRGRTTAQAVVDYEWDLTRANSPRDAADRCVKRLAAEKASGVWIIVVQWPELWGSSELNLRKHTFVWRVEITQPPPQPVPPTVRFL